MLSFFPRGVLDEILNLIESVSEEFPSYSSKRNIKVGYDTSYTYRVVSRVFRISFEGAEPPRRVSPI